MPALAGLEKTVQNFPNSEGSEAPFLVQNFPGRERRKNRPLRDKRAFSEGEGGLGGSK